MRGRVDCTTSKTALCPVYYEWVTSCDCSRSGPDPAKELLLEKSSVYQWWTKKQKHMKRSFVQTISCQSWIYDYFEFLSSSYSVFGLSMVQRVSALWSLQLGTGSCSTLARPYHWEERRGCKTLPLHALRFPQKNNCSNMRYHQVHNETEWLQWLHILKGAVSDLTTLQPGGLWTSRCEGCVARP